MVRQLSAPALLMLAACTTEPPSAVAPRTPSLEQVWRVGGLANPESVAPSQDGAFLYVTNVNGEGDAHDDNGFISLVSISGELLQREFATGLDGPKGIALSRGLLYVADIDRVVVIDAATGLTRRRLPVPGAVFLNDLAIAPNGEALVADSDASRIYAIRTDMVEVWLESDLLASVNGLLAEPSRLVVTTMQGRLLAIDYDTRAITVLADGLGDADGVAALEDGRYLVSEWPGRLFVVSPDGSHETLMDTRAESRLLNDFLIVGDVLYQPHWDPSELTAYRVVR